jgi:TnpA family transposase
VWPWSTVEARRTNLRAHRLTGRVWGTLRKKQEEELRNQAGCLNLVTNAVVTWNTVYMAAVTAQLRAEGRTVNEEDIARLSPARYEHINPYVKYRFFKETEK